MNILPAIDIKNGKCVRLYKGDFAKENIYNIDPFEVAEKIEKDGSKFLHIINLDGAKGDNSSNLDIIKKIIEKTNLQIQTGGGIKTESQIEELLKIGAKRVIIGSLVVKNPELVNDWIEEFGAGKIVLAFDFRVIDKVPYLAINGWQENSKTTLWEALDKFSNARYILCTDIDLDGTLASPNFDIYTTIMKKYPNLVLQASGGVSCLEDLKKLKELNIPEVIIGKALYEKKFSLKEALNVS